MVSFHLRWHKVLGRASVLQHLFPALLHTWARGKCWREVGKYPAGIMLSFLRFFFPNLFCLPTNYTPLLMSHQRVPAACHRRTLDGSKVNITDASLISNRSPKGGRRRIQGPGYALDHFGDLEKEHFGELGHPKCHFDGALLSKWSLSRATREKGACLEVNMTRHDTHIALMMFKHMRPFGKYILQAISSSKKNPHS